MEQYAPLKAIELSNDPKQLHSEILRLRSELFSLILEVSRLNSDLLDSQRKLGLHEALFADKSVEHLERVNLDLQMQIRALKASRSWKIGRIILSPLVPLRKIIRVKS